jgi:hypothetical protein
LYNETATKSEQYIDIVKFERLCADILTSINSRHRGIEPQSIDKKDEGKDAVHRMTVRLSSILNEERLEEETI